MKLIDIAFKDMLRSFRSLFAIGMMVVAPLLITGLIYVAFSGQISGNPEMPVTKVVVVNGDEPPAGAPGFGEMAIEMMSDASVAKWLQVSTAVDEATARGMVDRQEAGVAVIFPPDFSQALLSGEGNPEVRVIQDPTLTIGPLVVKNMVASLLDGATGGRIAMQASLERRAALGLPPDPAAMEAFIGEYQQWFVDFQRTLYHSPQAALITAAPARAEAGAESGAEEAGGMNRIFGLVLAGQMIFFSFYTGAYSMTSILQEADEGTLARLFTTPTDRTVILGGKFLAVALMVVVQALVMLLAGVVLFKVQWGQPLSVALAVLGQVAAATGLGVLLIALVKTSSQTGPVLGGGLTALGMFGGLFTVAVPSMPAVFTAMAKFTPQGWVLDGWKSCLAGAGPAEMLLPLLVLLIMGTIFFVIGAALFRRRFA